MELRGHLSCSGSLLEPLLCLDLTQDIYVVRHEEVSAGEVRTPGWRV